MRLARWHRRLVADGPGNLLDTAAFILFFPISFLYGCLAKVRVLFYRSGWLSAYRAPVPVISVGNLAVGGTGKTPISDCLLQKLLNQGIRVAVVSRGYGRSSREPIVTVCAGQGPLVTADIGGDEPVMLAKRNPQAVVIVAPDRQEGIRTAIMKYRPDVILLDDGFQHLKVKRDLDIVLLDATRPFSNGFPLPSGQLREFPGAIKRADILILTRSKGDEPFASPGKPVLKARFELPPYAVNAAGETTELKSLNPGRIGVFAGIAAPDSFFDSVRDTGLRISETLAFADHVIYGTHELSLLHGIASRCDVLLTTEKDLVKLGDISLPCDCLAVPLKITIDDPGDSLASAIKEIFEKYKDVDMLPDKLLEILACPQCKGEVEYKKEENQVCCHSCRLAYPVRDGIPVMLVDEAAKL